MADDDARDPATELALLDLASAHFGKVLAGVRPEQLSDRTPCVLWSVQALLEHVIGGDNWAALLLSSVEAGDAASFAKHTAFSGDQAADYAAGAATARGAFAAEGALDRQVRHPGGVMTGRQFLRMRVADLTVHAWDLARATGADETLPDELVAAALAMFEPMRERLGSMGVFGPGPEGAPEADGPQQRLLQLTGRRP